jgi:hypothetical protein
VLCLFVGVPQSREARGPKTLTPISLHGKVTGSRSLAVADVPRRPFSKPKLSQNFAPPQQSLDGSSQAGPEFNLAGDGPLRYLRRETSIENKGIGKLDWLAHRSKVAKCYSFHKSKDAFRGNPDALRNQLAFRRWARAERLRLERLF